MNRNPYRENIGDAEVPSQVASWARNWAETFRREAWQSSPPVVETEPLALLEHAKEQKRSSSLPS